MCVYVCVRVGKGRGVKEVCVMVILSVSESTRLIPYNAFLSIDMCMYICV